MSFYLYRCTLSRVFDRLSFDPVAFDPRSFDRMSVNPIINNKIELLNLAKNIIGVPSSLLT